EMFRAETSDGVMIRCVVDAGMFHLAEHGPAMPAERYGHTRQGHQCQPQRLWIAWVVTAQQTHATGSETGTHPDLPRPHTGRGQRPPGSEHPRRSEDAISLWLGRGKLRDFYGNREFHECSFLF